jgi:hypothetical protein
MGIRAIVENDGELQLGAMLTSIVAVLNTCFRVASHD